MWSRVGKKWIRDVKEKTEKRENRKPSPQRVKTEERSGSDDVGEGQSNKGWGRKMSSQLKACFQSWLWLVTVTMLCSSLTHPGVEVQNRVSWVFLSGYTTSLNSSSVYPPLKPKVTIIQNQLLIWLEFPLWDSHLLLMINMCVGIKWSLQRNQWPFIR